MKLLDISGRCCSCHLTPPCSFCVDLAPDPDEGILACSDLMGELPAGLLAALPVGERERVEILLADGVRLGVRWTVGLPLRTARLVCEGVQNYDLVLTA